MAIPSRRTQRRDWNPLSRRGQQVAVVSQEARLGRFGPVWTGSCTLFHFWLLWRSFASSAFCSCATLTPMRGPAGGEAPRWPRLRRRLTWACPKQRSPRF
jgi:hypothetical protein